jgi:hypothetical protein
MVAGEEISPVGGRPALKTRIRTWARNLWGFRWVRAAAYAGLLAAVVSSALPNEYDSTAVVLPSDVNAGGLAGLSLAASALGFNLPGVQTTPDQTFETILESRWLGEGLLTQTYEFKMAPYRFMRPRPYRMTLLEYLGEPNVDKGMKSLPKIFSVDRNIKTSVVTIDTYTRSPELSQQITMRAVALLEEFLTQHNQVNGKEKARFAIERLRDAEQAADDSEARLRVFLMVNRNYQQSDDPEVRLKGARLEADLNLRRQVISTLAMNREQSLVDEKNDTPILYVLERGNLPIEKGRPHRALWTALAAVLAGLWAWGVEHKKKVLAFLQEESV